ncbi:MAG: sigma-70 family RNA polymerase sigma factor [Candidatus Korobacteraceae bacterium]
MSVGETALTGPVGRIDSGQAISAEEFAEVMRAHQRRIHRLLLSFVRDPDEADSLTQECFLRAYRNWSSFRGDSSIATWLSRIAVNLARDEAKNRRRSFWRRLLALDAGSSDGEQPYRIDAPAETVSPEQALLAREQLQEVWAVVDRLPSQQRAVFLLRFVHEMSLEEVAQVLEVELGTVKSHLSRAVATVRRQVKHK